MSVLKRQRLSISSTESRSFQSILFSRTRSLTFDTSHGRLPTDQVTLGNTSSEDANHLDRAPDHVG